MLAPATPTCMNGVAQECVSTDWKETPTTRVAWGSDIAAQMLRRFGIPYISLNPGASYRGLHDSLVNHLGNENPGILLCLHEDHSVAIAHGYAKATGEPMACVLHRNVGLLHGMMGLFNAWCDRVPMFVLGATGPVDAEKRRPWIDWIHTSRDQGASSAPSSNGTTSRPRRRRWSKSMTRANMLTRSAPTAPVYICLDAGFQESAARQGAGMARPDALQAAGAAAAVEGGASTQALALLQGRAAAGHHVRPRLAQAPSTGQPRIALAERLGACVLTDLKQGAMFPTDHPAHYVPPFNVLGKQARELVVRGRRHPRARLDRSRRRAAPGARTSAR